MSYDTRYSHQLQPGDPGYLSESGDTRQCASVPSDGRWMCTRAWGHSGGHAAHGVDRGYGCPQYASWPQAPAEVTS